MIKSQKINGKSEENDKILSLVLADRVQEVRKLKNPSAEDILKELEA